MDTSTTQLDAVFGALSDKTRRQILVRLRERDCTVMELAGEFDISLPAVSKHLKVLDHAGLLRRRKDGRQVICNFEAQQMKAAVDWINQQYSFWNEGFEKLADWLDEQPENDSTL
jgi:DNA-binding transcriptional ArsR family regulator